MASEESVTGTKRFEAVTLLERDDGTRTMKLGRHEGRPYINEDNELAGETGRIVEFDTPKSRSELQHAADFPQPVQEFFGVDQSDGGSE